MEHSLYPVPPRFTVRRLVLMDLAAICTLYGACGRDAAWGTRETLAALFGEGEWWGGFLGGELVGCCACVPARSATPQAAALRGALAPARLPARFLLPPAATPEGRAFAGRFLSLLGERLWPPCASPEKRLAAAVPVKTGGLLLDGFSRRALRCSSCARGRRQQVMRAQRRPAFGSLPRERRMKTPYGVCTSLWRTRWRSPACWNRASAGPPCTRARTGSPRSGWNDRIPHKKNAPAAPYIRTHIPQRTRPLKRRARFGGVCVRSIFLAACFQPEKCPHSTHRWQDSKHICFSFKNIPTEILYKMATSARKG